MSYPYSRQFVSPFPILPVILRRVEGGVATATMTALVDTGADFTLAPLTYLRQLQIPQSYQTNVRSHWGELTSVNVHIVDLEVAGELLPAIDVVADRRGKEIILGRDVLNRLILLLDGIRQQTDVLTRRPLRF